LGEVALDGDQLVTSGVIGYVMVVTGCGPTASTARSSAYQRLEKVCVPNARYRRDIGERFIATDEARLDRWGWL
jgi:phosphoribosylamine--glycine ligase